MVGASGLEPLTSSSRAVIGEHGPEVLPLTTLDFLDSEMARAAFRPRPIPRFEERPFGPARRPLY